MEWNKEVLENVVRSRLDKTKLILVANREPYIHFSQDGEIRCERPASGLTSALDPVMRACGGVWIAHGTGDADWDVVDGRGRITVPPDDPHYSLQRIWLSRKEEEGYFYGFARSTLWPLCHQTFFRPKFEREHWERYVAVNRKFADAVLKEANGPALVFVHDYHFTLLPRMLKTARPDLVIAHFWHIPWPNWEIFRICPWAEEILDGLLGNDLLSFQVSSHRDNFLETVARSKDFAVDMQHGAATRCDHSTLVRSHPISVDSQIATQYVADDEPGEQRKLRDHLRVDNRPLLIGVDCVDHIKGIPERLRAVDRLLTRHPELREQFHFVQIGGPSREHLVEYRLLSAHALALADEINWKHGDKRWTPIIFLNSCLSPETIFRLYRISAGCVVTSLHDGMNLVAKEFVAARTDGQGVLVLSRFTGAACELPDAVLINPYDLDEVAEAMHAALTMTVDEQGRRMERMRRQVAENNVYRWAGTLLSEACSLLASASPATSLDAQTSDSDIVVEAAL